MSSATQGQAHTGAALSPPFDCIPRQASWQMQRSIVKCVLLVSQAVKRISAQHRLILSGTPIQNNVLELWALFDFLMPGFLGTHAAFNARYGKALAASKGSKTGSPEAQAGLLAMEGLHKQVCDTVLYSPFQTVLYLPHDRIS